MPYGHLYHAHFSKERVMGPKVSVCRKGDDIFLSIEGDFTDESSQELLSTMRQLITTSLKCAAPGSRVSYSLKTRGKVNLEKIAEFHHVINDQSCYPGICEEPMEKQDQNPRPLQEESSNSQARNGLILIKGGAL
jgi:hypothetical protein